MAVNLLIKSVPDSWIEKLKKRAQKNHRSLQAELMTILEQSLSSPPALSGNEAIGRLKQIGLKTRTESTRIIRESRNRR